MRRTEAGPDKLATKSRQLEARKMNLFKTTSPSYRTHARSGSGREYFGGEDGAIIAFAIAAAMNFFSYFYSDKLALRMYRAQPVTRDQLPRVYAVVERLTAAPAFPCRRFM
jgi:Zn-dependent protease with chaperone function